MKKIYLLTCLAYLPVLLSAQWLSQSAEGKGSVLTKGSSISVDPGKTDVNFTLNNLNRAVDLGKENSYLIFGGSLSAKNEEGIGNLFSKGDFVPSSKLTAFAGIRFLKNDKYLTKINDNLNGRLQKLNEAQTSLFRERTQVIIGEEMEDAVFSGSNTGKTLSQDWLQEVKTTKSTSTFITYLKGYSVANIDPADHTSVRQIAARVIEAVRNMQKDFSAQQSGMRKEIVSYFDGYSKSNNKKMALFLFGGFDGSSFKRFDSVNKAEPSASFIKEEYRGGNIGIGLNYQLNSFRFGLTYAYKKTNNFALLDKTDYKLMKTTTSGEQELTEEKAITAYSGDYGKVEMNELNFDVIWNLSLGKDSDAYTLLNGYLRSNMFSRNKELLPSSFNIGVASYFFTKKSKFMGGIYVELPDVDDSFERSKPVDDQNIRPALRRLTFGVVGKFTISSLISWQ